MQNERVDQMQAAVLSLDHSVALVALAHKQGMFPGRFLDDHDNSYLLDDLAKYLECEPLSSFAADAARSLLAYDAVTALSPDYDEGGFKHVLNEGLLLLCDEGIIDEVKSADSYAFLGLAPFTDRTRAASGLLDAAAFSDLLAQEYHMILSDNVPIPTIINDAICSYAGGPYVEQKAHVEQLRAEKSFIDSLERDDLSRYVVFHILVEILDLCHQNKALLRLGSEKPFLTAHLAADVIGSDIDSTNPWAAQWNQCRTEHSDVFDDTAKWLESLSTEVPDTFDLFKTIHKSRLALEITGWGREERG
jgi:hypothetical protein